MIRTDIVLDRSDDITVNEYTGSLHLSSERGAGTTIHLGGGDASNGHLHGLLGGIARYLTHAGIDVHTAVDLALVGDSEVAS